MNAQAAVDGGRVHHQWLPDHIQVEHQEISPDTISLLQQYGHRVVTRASQGVAQMIVIDHERGLLEGGADRRYGDSTAAGY